MPLHSDPVFFSSVKRDSGAKRRLIHLSCSEDRDVTVEVREMEKPEWIEIEGVFPGQKLTFERGKPASHIVNLNTTHKFFPRSAVKGEVIRITFDNDEILEIFITIPEIIDVVEPFRGVFACDFGTTNSCFAFRGGTSKASKNLQSAKSSPEMPTVAYFHDVSDPVRPRYSIGTEALFDIRENSSHIYAYTLGIKRMLGQDRSMVMLDPHGGVKPGHQQEWHVEEIASFIIRELLNRAEEELGQRVEQVVATFPPMFSRDRREAIRRAFARALEAGGVQINDKSIVMDLDEANAGAFHYIYSALLDEFRRFNITQKQVDLLAYDFGGGTIDIALVGVKITRTPQGRLSIETELKGLSGEAALGGDNVTLELFRVAKLRVAAAAAAARAREAAEKAKVAQKSKSAADDIWGAPAPKKVSMETDMFSRAPEKKDEAPAVQEEIDPELALIVNRENPGVFENACATLAREKDVLEEAIAAGKTVAEIVAAKERVRDLAEKRIKQIETAIETVLPTQFAKYQDVDPHKEVLARKLFYELWHEVDALKIRLAGSEGQPRPISGILRKIARYAGVDPIAFNEIHFTMAELEKRIDARVTESVRKAHELYRSAAGGAKGGIAVAKKAEESALRILLFGNSSNLPIVRRKFQEIFKAPDENLVFNAGQAKTAVATGACEEYALRKTFGETGLIQYKPMGFLDKIPYSIGLFHRDLSLVGWQNGFWPLFARGTAVEATKDVSEKSNFLIHPELRELPIYVDYLDGAPPRPIGFIDFTKPLEGATDPSSFEQTPDESGATFRIRIQLLPTRELVAINLQTGQRFGMVMEKASWVTEENPFAGVH